jgi:hypothetical protein
MESDSIEQAVRSLHQERTDAGTALGKHRFFSADGKPYPVYTCDPGLVPVVDAFMGPLAALLDSYLDAKAEACGFAMDVGLGNVK